MSLERGFGHGLDGDFDPKRHNADRARGVAGRAAFHCGLADRPAPFPGRGSARLGRDGSPDVRAVGVPADQLLPDGLRLRPDAGLWRAGPKGRAVARRLRAEAGPARGAGSSDHVGRPGRSHHRGLGHGRPAAQSRMVRLGPASGPGPAGPGLRRPRRPGMERAHLVDLGPDRLLPGLSLDRPLPGPRQSLERPGLGRRRLSAGQSGDLVAAGLSRLADADALRLLPRPAVVLPGHVPGPVRRGGVESIRAWRDGPWPCRRSPSSLFSSPANSVWPRSASSP